MVRVRAAYPGFLAPASLKRHRDGRIRPGRFPYPGFLAPASLKHLVLGSIVTVTSCLSGVSCPGLIEAVEHRPD